MIKLSKSSISNLEKSNVQSVLSKEYLGIGEHVKEFEDNLSNFFGRNVVCLNSGTAALHLALQAIGIKENDEVLVPSLTYVASYQAIKASGAKPVSCDISLNNLCIDLNDAKKKININTKAIMPVYYSGDASIADDVILFAKDNGIRVVEDAAHAFGSVSNKKIIGSFGDISCFSFDGIKNITCGEGGCVVTSDIDVINKVKDSRLLGVEKDSENRYKGMRSWNFNVYDQGWRYHMSNINAAIGIAQLERFDAFKLKRQKLSMLYDNILNNYKNIEVYKRNYDEITPHIYVIRIKGLKNFDIIKDKFLKNGIEIGRHYFPNHLLKYFKEDISLINTELVYNELITLPLHYDLNEKDIIYITDVLKKII